MVTTVSASHATTVETVTLQLQWKHQFEFAGFYAAIHKGIYAKYGIHLELKEYQPGIDNLEEVLSGRAQYGLYHSGIIQARLEGKPLILLANYFKSLPLVILAKPPLRTLADLKGKRLMVSRKDLDSPLYKLAFAHEKLNPNENITIVPHSFDTEPFIRNEIDAMSALLSNEPFYLEQRGIAFNIIDLYDYMRSMGDMYLFTSETQAKHRPHLTQDLITATNDGWQYALEHKAEIVDLILSKYSQRKSREALLYEAEKTHELIMPLPLPIGAVFEDVIQDVAKFFKQQHLITYPGNLTGFIFNYSSQQGLNTLHFTPEEHAWLAQHSKIVLGISDQFSPDVITHADGSHSGLVVDYFKLLNQELDNKLVLHIETDWNSITQKAIQRKIDGLASSVPNPIWDKHFLYSNPFYFGYFYPYVHTDNTFQANHITDLIGKRVGYLSGMKKAELFLNSITGINKIALNNNEEVAEALINKRIDVFVGPIDLEWWRKQHSNLNFKLAGIFTDSEHPIVMSIRNDWPILIKIINRALDNIPLEIHENIRQRWFSDLVQVPKQSQLNLTLEEQTYLNNVSVKRALAIGRQPFNFKDNTGNIVGIAEDYWQLIRSKLELRETTSEKISIEDVPTAIQNNMADVHPNIMYKEEYASYAVFSDVYDEYPIAIATRKNEGFISNAAVLEGRTVAVGINYNAYYLLKEKYPTIKFLLVPDTAAALQQVAEGKAFAAVDVLPVLQYQITQLGHDKIALTGVSDIKYPLQIMLHQKHARLLPLINRAIADITPEEHLEINKKWLLRDVIININYEHLWQLIIVAALIISTILYWNRRLRLEIDYRKKIEAQLSKLSRAVEQSHNMVVITDLDANIEFVNPAFTNVTGYTFQEAIGQNPRILNSGYHTKDFYLNMWEKLDHGQVWQGEILNKRKNGELYWENVIISPIKDEAGVTTHFVAIKEDINLRKLAEQALKKSQTQYQRLVEDIGPNFVIYSYRSDSIIEYVNKGANTVFGVNAAELIGRSWPSAISWISDSLYRALEVNKKFVTGELTEAELEMEFIHPNGNLRTINVTIHPVCDANDKYIYSEGIVENITERKHIQRQIEEQRRTLHTILENIPAGVQVIAANGKIILNNQHAEQILKTKIIDKTPIKELNRMYSAFIYGTDILYPHENMPIVRGLLGETSMVEDMELRHPDGSRMLLQVIGAPIPDINGNINSSVVIFFDITARKEMERIRQLNESRLDTLLELSHKAPNMTEEELCKAGQEAAEKLTSSKISYLHLINPEQETAVQYQLETERFISVPIIEDETVKMIIGVGNKASPYDEYDLRQLQRIAEDLWHIIIRRRTETELKTARHAAEAASNAKSTFIAHISHELRTPLTGILGFAQLLLMDKSLSNIHREYVHTMQKSGEHLLDLINEILDLAKIGAGKLELNPVPVHLPSLLEEAIAITKIRADNKGLYLSLDMETLPTAVLVDHLRLNQIVLNLLGNAIKFTHHGEVKLWIRTQPILELTDSIQITFAVLDTGPGIPADCIRHVLLPFERLANQTNEGAGLGLSISNALISKMGGQLILGSQTAPGLWAATINEIPPLLITADHGTIAWFSLTLPLTTIAETIELELINTDSKLTTENNMRLTSIDIPNLSVLNQVIRLTEAGNVVGLQKFCDSTQKNYPVFTVYVLNYLEQFQLNELKVFLNNLETSSG